MLDFPNTPTTGQTFASGALSWAWDGTKWIAGSVLPADTNVVLLLHFDGANGATTFPDSSASAHTVTGTGGGALTTAQQKFGTASLQSGSGAVISSADSNDWYFAAGPFTAEAWIRPTATIGGLCAVMAQYGSGQISWWVGVDYSGPYFYYSLDGSSPLNIGGPFTYTTNAWLHIAVDRDAAHVVRVYAGGAVIASGTVAGALFNSSLALSIGNDATAAHPFAGQIDELRISKGIARYGGAFTPPTAPFLP